MLQQRHLHGGSSEPVHRLSEIRCGVSHRRRLLPSCAERRQYSRRVIYMHSLKTEAQQRLAILPSLWAAFATSVADALKASPTPASACKNPFAVSVAPGQECRETASPKVPVGKLLQGFGNFRASYIAFFRSMSVRRNYTTIRSSRKHQSC